MSIRARVRARASGTMKLARKQRLSFNCFPSLGKQERKVWGRTATEMEKKTHSCASVFYIFCRFFFFRFFFFSVSVFSVLTNILLSLKMFLIRRNYWSVSTSWEDTSCCKSESKVLRALSSSSDQSGFFKNKMTPKGAQIVEPQRPRF